jgi:hypothetical protein
MKGELKMTLIILIILAVIGSVGWGLFQKHLVDVENLSPTLFATITPLVAVVFCLIYGLIFDPSTLSTSNLSKMINGNCNYLIVSGLCLSLLYISVAQALSKKEVFLSYVFLSYIPLTLIAMPTVERIPMVNRLLRPKDEKRPKYEKIPEDEKIPCL